MTKRIFYAIIDAQEELRQWKKILLLRQNRYGDEYFISEAIEKIEKIIRILEN